VYRAFAPEKTNFAPFGDHAPSRLNAAGGDPVSDTGDWFEPSAFIVYSVALPSRSDVNTIFEPSGDQSGTKSSYTAFVSWMGEPPAAGTLNTSLVPSWLLPYTIHWPSGDHDGAVLSLPSNDSNVSCVAPVPFAFITKMFLQPAVVHGAEVVLRENAIFVPSGDHAGSWSTVGLLFVRFVSPVPSGFTV
jgi:hypothetical protein